MIQNRWSMICLCSHFKQEEGLRPLTTAEFHKLSTLLKQWGKTPGDLFRMSFRELISMGFSMESCERLFTLLDRVFALESLVDSYADMGIQVVTAAEPSYFPMLKATLNTNCPPVLCYAGDLSLGAKSAMGFVGARDITPEDGEFAIHAVRKALSHGFAIVSGGARGVDSISEEEALHQGGSVVEFPAVSLMQRLRTGEFARFVEQKQLLLASPATPHTGFSSSLATARNRMIYAHSTATVVIRATRCSGGTWSGATDALKRQFCPVLCWDAPYEGNRALLQNGAVAINADWNGTLPPGISKSIPTQTRDNDLPEQFSIF